MVTKSLTISFLLVLSTILFSCSSDATDPGAEPDVPNPLGQLPAWISALDLSALPEIQSEGVQYFDEAGVAIDPLDFARVQGVNTIRLRLWVNPASGHSDLSEVRDMAQAIRGRGMKLWITAHYSDTWADPGSQDPPAAWQGLDFSGLRERVAQYTTQVVGELEPDIFQIGNEINPGILLPAGDRFAREEQFLELLRTAAASARAAHPGTAIMLHYAGLTGSMDFFRQVSGVDYDLIGLSYYPIWHGKDLSSLQATIESLGSTYEKEVLIAETAYPFTLDFNDFTNNIIGLESQLILPEYPATPLGQRNFLTDLRQRVGSASQGRGWCYWAPEWIAFRGSQSTDGSPWENNALFDFTSRALPAWDVFDPAF